MIGSTQAAGPSPPFAVYSARLRRDREKVDREQVIVAGEVDLATAGLLRGALLAAVGRGGVGQVLQVDLSRVSFLDASGIGVLIEARLAADRSGMSFLLHNPRGMVRRVLEASGATTALGTPPAGRPRKPASRSPHPSVTASPGRGYA